jgi:hypothetical protein
VTPEDRDVLRRLVVMNQAIAIVITPWLGAELFETGLPSGALRLMAVDLEGMATLLRERADAIENIPLTKEIRA